ncbi:hypothetical protein D9611_003461 [Ephemerocybe angulata]|uniref:ATP11-domain-containing protein n=1 Tax=Ephemerocybe angulata TaxID=980116 RepID=A0A8H5C874_9AGAR|nr:hypothetical protein D9611_003461 [Tulosesus angulatus]
MHRHLLRSARLTSLRTPVQSPGLRSTWKVAATVRTLQTSSIDPKYVEKLKQRAKEAGLTLEELAAKAKEEAAKKKQEEREALEATLPIRQIQAEAETAPSSSTSTASSEKPVERTPKAVTKERKDSSPVKPLSSILNLERIFEKPHTAEQIASLWTVYHAKASGGTGRGAVCASVPLDLYKRMESVAQQYSAFVVPLSRPRPASAEPLKEGESDTAYEFYFMQWLFHEKPPVPRATDPNNPFDIPSAKNSTNPPLATILFTPLQEYKQRQSFATPYLITTFYTDLATTHNTVLMRGEITPSAASANPGTADRFLLSQEDTQVLIMMLQRFYLWNKEGDAESTATTVLKTFHERPEEFKWEDLVKAATVI